MTRISNTNSTAFDLLVIGGGSGGLASAKRAAKHGARVGLIERDKLGGTCVNRGCVPKKLMWMAAHQQHVARHFDQMSLASRTTLDYRQLHTNIANHIDGLRDMFEGQLEDAGITLLRGEARVTSKDEITVDDRELRTGKLLLATGARPKRPDFDGADLASVSEDVFAWTDPPERLLIIGGGYIGCEFATIFTALGVHVTLATDGDGVLDQFVPCATRVVEDNLKAQGVDLRLETVPRKIMQSSDGLETHLSDGTVITADKVLLATGRQPNVDKLGPICKELTVADSGALAISDRFETSQADVFAVGDAADRLPLTPVATRDGETFADQHFGDGATQVDLGKVSSTTFTIPPIAQVGTMPSDSGFITNNGLGQGVVAPDHAQISGYSLNMDGDTLAGVTLLDGSAPDMIAPFSALLGHPESRRLLLEGTGVHPSFAEELMGR